MFTPARHRIENHAGEACIERYRGAIFCDKKEPLLAMREVSLCILAAAARWHDAFNRRLEPA
jgi:hypothetical protein